MKRIDRIREQLSEARAEYLRAFRDCNVAASQPLRQKVEQLELMLEEAEQYESKCLREVLPKETMRQEKIAEEIAAIHLVMDCLVEIAMNFREKLQRHNLMSTELYGKVQQLEKYANDILADVCRIGHKGLIKFITEDSELIDDMSKMVYEYVDRTLEKDDKAQ